MWSIRFSPEFRCTREKTKTRPFPIAGIFLFIAKCTVHCSVTDVCHFSTFKAVLSAILVQRSLFGCFRHCLAHYSLWKVKAFSVRPELFTNQRPSFDTECVMPASLPTGINGICVHYHKCTIDADLSEELPTQLMEMNMRPYKMEAFS